jgi:hypothetical protein
MKTSNLFQGFHFLKKRVNLYDDIANHPYVKQKSLHYSRADSIAFGALFISYVAHVAFSAIPKAV